MTFESFEYDDDEDEFNAALADEAGRLPPHEAPADQPDEPAPLLSPLSAADLLSRPIEPREWLWQGYLPAGCTTLLASDGGTGKSLLAQQVATAVAAGEPLFGLPTSQSAVLGIYSEDDWRELAERQQNISREMDLNGDQIAGSHIQSLFGGATHLGHYIRGSSEFQPGALFEAICERAIETGARLVILDNVTQIYPGDPNDAGQVASFVQALNALALAINGSVLLLGHIAKSEGSTFSGSAAWSNSVRHRLFLEWRDDKRTAPPGCAKRQNLRTLSVEKSNYGPKTTIDIEWKGGAFHLDQPLASRGIQHRTRQDDQRQFLDLLAELTARRIAVSAKPNAKNYAPAVMVYEHGGDLDWWADVMNDLIEDGQISTDDLGWRNDERQKVRGLAPVTTTGWGYSIASDTPPVTIDGNGIKGGDKPDLRKGAVIAPPAPARRAKLDDILNRINDRVAKSQNRGAA